MSRSARAVVLVVVAVALVQAAWILTVPPFRGSDEFDHAYRAVSVADGQWTAGVAAPEGRGLLVEVPSPLVAAASAQCASLPYTGVDNCVGRELGGGRTQVATGAGSYHPAWYLVTGVVAVPFDETASLYALRLAGAVLCLLFLGAAVTTTARRPGPWPTIGVLVACSPVLLYSTATAAPNGLEMAAAVSLWVAVLALLEVDDDRTRRRTWWLAVAAAVVVATLRLLGPFFLVLLAVTVAAWAGRDLGAVVRALRWRVWVGVALVAAAVGGAAAWVLGAGAAEPDPTSTDGTSWGANHVVAWTLQTIAAFPYRNQPGPVLAYPVVGALALGLVVVALRATTTRRRLVVVVALLVALLLPVAFTVATAGSQGVIWQGRYGLPYAVGFLVLSGFALRDRAAPHVAVLTAGVVAWSAVLAACLVKVRNDELGLAPSAGDPTWHVPPVWLIIALVVTAGAMLLGALRLLGEAPARA